MRRSHLVINILFAVCLLVCGATQAQRIGQWTGYPSYTSLRHLADTPNRIYAASPKALFYYDRDDFTIHTLTKGDGLNDVGVSTIAYDPQTKCLVVAYVNGNIDILQNDVTYNISGIKQWGYTGDKGINSITFHNKRAWLACGFGLVVIDLQRKEIEDTYYFQASDGGNSAVNDVAFLDTTIFLATPKGLLSTHANNPYLNIEESWTVDTSAVWDTSTPLYLAAFADGLAMVTMGHDPSDLTLSCLFDDSLHTVTTGYIQSIRSSGSHLVVSMWDSVVLYNVNLSPDKVIHDFSGNDILAHDAIETSDHRVWIAHEWAGMVVEEEDGSSFSTSPSGPGSDNVYRIRSTTDGIAVCPGGKSSTNANLYLDGNIYRYTNHEWIYLDKNKNPVEFADVLDVAQNPTDANNFAAASWGFGLLDIVGNEIRTLFNETNSQNALHPLSIGDFKTLRTGAVVYDMGGNLWALNSVSDSGLVVRYADGTWRAFYTAPIVRGAEIYNLLLDTVTGYLWFSGRDNRIYVHNGADLMSWVDPNNGSRLQTSSVNCLAQDQNGHIWIGTDKGIKVIYDPYKAFNNGGNGELSPVVCSNILFSEDDLVEYLLAYESITSIAVDGANRKWIGTAAGGLYLLSATGLEQLENYTAENSPLFSNKIVAVGIHPITGEVFIGTDMGLQSYRSTATFATTEPEKKIHVFPNPVRPDYDGPVAFRGFTRNAIVHITDEAGHVIYSTRADGGQAVWNIRTNSGSRVSSGVYFVFASDEEGHNKSVGKVLVIK